MRFTDLSLTRDICRYFISQTEEQMWLSGHRQDHWF